MSIEKDVITSDQVVLPEQYEQPTLRGLLPGEATYTTPWSVWFDLQGSGWVALDSSPHNEKGGTAELWLGRYEEGFVANLRNLGAQWRRQPKPSGVGFSAENAFPVIGLITNGHERRVAVRALKKLPGYTNHTPLP